MHKSRNKCTVGLNFFFRLSYWSQSTEEHGKWSSLVCQKEQIQTIFTPEFSFRGNSNICIMRKPVWAVLHLSSSYLQRWYQCACLDTGTDAYSKTCVSILLIGTPASAPAPRQPLLPHVTHTCRCPAPAFEGLPSHWRPARTPLSTHPADSSSSPAPATWPRHASHQARQAARYISTRPSLGLGLDIRFPGHSLKSQLLRPTPVQPRAAFCVSPSPPSLLPFAVCFSFLKHVSRDTFSVWFSVISSTSWYTAVLQTVLCKWMI